MRLLIDAGNTRLKWRLATGDAVVAEGLGAFDDDLLSGFPATSRVRRISVSTVAAEPRRQALTEYLEARFSIPVAYHWAESGRGGLVNAYEDPRRMGADRWHAMYAAWIETRSGFVVVDAGSAITVDFVDDAGRHIGGYILPGLQMMLRSLKTDAARILFDGTPASDSTPGTTTGECVHHGVSWMLQSATERVLTDAEQMGIQRVIVTGGDAGFLLQLGLKADYRPDLVLDGLAAIDAEDLAL
ncbi:MAG: type III pantothenate kinase [Marinobacter sp.]|nr:type III pantothenate kinase [Marinobacter sp.]